MYQYKATPFRVIDGDTVVMDVDLGFYIWMKNIHFRLIGIDTPERGRDGFEAARDFVQKFFVDNPIVIVNVFGHDSFGRWLAEILDPEAGTTLNHQLVSLGLAKTYPS